MRGTGEKVEEKMLFKGWEESYYLLATLMGFVSGFLHGIHGRLRRAKNWSPFSPSLYTETYGEVERHRGSRA